MHSYDLVVPFGEYCATAIALKNSGIRKASYPFDWSGGRLWNKCGTCGFLGKIKLICDDFKNAFELDDLSEFWNTEKNYRSVINNSTGLMFVHEFPWDKSVEKHYPEFKEKYNRRVERLYKDIEQAQNILFVFATRRNSRLALSDIEKGYQMLMQKFPLKTVNFLILFSSTELSETEFFSYRYNPNITIVLYKDIETSGEGNQFILQKIFKTYIQNIYSVSFNTDDVFEIGLSYKEDWGRWSDGKKVYLSIPMPYISDDVKLDFFLIPFPPEKGKQSISIQANGEQILTHEFSKSGEQHLYFNFNKDLNSRRFLELEFDISSPTHPKKYNEKDPRLLGVGFKTLTISRI